MLIVETGKVKPIDVESSHWTKYIISGGVAELNEME
jgi:uncharacterized membrane protein